jgi:hypothetical protein
MRACLVAGCALGLAAFGAGCGRDSHAVLRPGAETETSPTRSSCGHAACGNGFFVDIGSTPTCKVGSTCTLWLTLVATGNYHINDEYPYKFRAEDVPGVEFSGTDGAGKNVFSKAAKNWSKEDERTGRMTVTFQPAEKGTKPIAGVFKLSVCSAQNCQLEQQQVTATIEVS